MKDKEEKNQKIVKEIFKNRKSEIPLQERKKQIDEFLSLLTELWMIVPRQRFAQILYNFTKMGTPMDKKIGPMSGLKDFFYYEDNHIIEDIKKNIKELKTKTIKQKS